MVSLYQFFYHQMITMVAQHSTKAIMMLCESITKHMNLSVMGPFNAFFKDEVVNGRAGYALYEDERQMVTNGFRLDKGRPIVEFENKVGSKMAGQVAEIEKRRHHSLALLLVLDHLLEVAAARQSIRFVGEALSFSQGLILN